MAWKPSPKVADCRDIARKWKARQVVILAVSESATGLQLEYASYGENRQLCDQARHIGDKAYDAAYKVLGGAA
jgi:hypothetical protein